jgi:hypothetical protein
MVVAVLLAFGIGQLESRASLNREAETRQKMERIYIELANYVQQNNRLPCPADPTVDPNNRTFGLETLNAGTAGQCLVSYGLGAGGQTFIVPFRTLNLNESDIRDEWGNFFTYAVSRVVTETYLPTDPAPLTDARPTNVHAYCRTAAGNPATGLSGPATQGRWVIDVGLSSSNIVNINPRKAMFCCPGHPSGAGAGTFYPGQAGRQHHNIDLWILNTTPIFPPSASSLFRTSMLIDQNNAPIDPATLPAGPSAETNIEYWGFVLISHGPNGRIAPTLNNEGGNLNNDNVLFSLPRNISPAATATDYFDDLVLHASQFQLMARLNNGSCMTPFYSYQR